MHDELSRLLSIMARLRDPAQGCAWDVAQTFASIAPYTIEEAYEVADAIEREDLAGLKEELGDLLLQVVFHARMAEERGRFDFAAVAKGIADKMVARHPHVFGDAASRALQGESGAWEAHKAAERAAKAAAEGRPLGALDGVSLALPALTRAEKLQKRAARVGFDWPEAAPVLDKIAEEIGELRAEIAAGNADGLEDELGDVLFAVANLARHCQVDPEAALRRTNAKFERRFRAIEARLAAEARAPETETLDELERLWTAIKLDERLKNKAGTR